MRLTNFKIIFTLHILYQITNLFLSPLLLTSFFFFFFFFINCEIHLYYFSCISIRFFSPHLLFIFLQPNIFHLYIFVFYIYFHWSILFSSILFLFFFLLKRTLTHQRREREGGGKRGKDERWFDAKEDEWTLKGIR